MTDTGTASDSGSEARVAYDLFVRLAGHLPGQKQGLDRIQELLNLYAECSLATRGLKHDAKRIA